MSFILAVAALIVGIAALSKSSSAENKLLMLQKELKELKQGADLKEKETQPSAQAEKIAEQRAPATTETEKTAAAEEKAPLLEENKETLPAVQPLAAQETEKPESKPIDIAHIFSWIGGVLLILGAIFTFYYMMQKGYITMALLLSLAAAIGVLLTAAGLLIKEEKIQTTASTLCAVGLSLCFITAFSAHNFFDYLSAPAAFIFMAITAFASFAVSYIKDRQYISVLALIAAFITPILLSSKDGNYIFLFSYLFLVNASCVAIAIRKGWNSLIWTVLPITLIYQFVFSFGTADNEYTYVIYSVYALAAACTALIPADKIKRNTVIALGLFVATQVFILSCCLTNHNLAVLFGAAAFVSLLVLAYEFIRKTNAVIFVSLAGWGIFYSFYLMKYTASPAAGYAALAVFAVYFAYPLIFRNNFKDGSAAWFGASTASFAAFTPVYFQLVKPNLPDYLGLAPFFFALCFFVPVLNILRNEQFKKARAVFTAIAVIYATMILPVQFTEKWLTILLSIYALALCWLDLKTENKSLKIMAKIIFCTVFIRLTLNPYVLEYCAGGAKIFNWFLLTYAAAAGSMFWAAKLCKQEEDLFKSFLYAGGAFLLFALMNIEIADYFAVDGRLKFNFAGHFAEAVTYTLAWAVYGTLACFTSMLFKKNMLGKVGVILIFAALMKLAFVDLWYIGMFYRICGAFGMAVLLLGAAFIFQKFNNTKA